MAPLSQGGGESSTAARREPWAHPSVLILAGGRGAGHDCGRGGSSPQGRCVYVGIKMALLGNASGPLRGDALAGGKGSGRGLQGLAVTMCVPEHPGMGALCTTTVFQSAVCSQPCLLRELPSASLQRPAMGLSWGGEGGVGGATSSLAPPRLPVWAQGRAEGLASGDRLWGSGLLV